MFIDKYTIPHVRAVPATRMRACHLQLNAIHTLSSSIESAFTHSYFSKTNYTRANLIFWVCLAPKNQFLPHILSRLGCIWHLSAGLPD